MLEYVKTDSIITSNDYLRLNGNVEKLKKSIETIGLINPIIINKNFNLLAGGRRLTAMKELGMDEVPVIKVDKNNLEEELISIDENLVRLDLNKVEFEQCLSRANQIYDELHPGMPTMDEELEAEKENPGQRLTETETFLEYTADKTGLSKKAIKSAIDRDRKASTKIKKARLAGELNASQTNEIIKLDKKDQEKIMDIAVGKSAADIKKLVKNVQSLGTDQAINIAVNEKPLPKEFKNLKTMVTRLNRISNKILLENMSCDHEEMEKIISDTANLRNNLNELLAMFGTTQKVEDEIAADDMYMHDSASSEVENHSFS